MNHYLLRLAHFPGYDESFDQAFPQDRFPKILGVYHTGKSNDNPHYHFVFQCDYKMPALRMHLKKSFSAGSGNRHLSIKSRDLSQGDTCLSYMFHEDTRDTFKVVINRGYDTEAIKKIKISNEKIQKKISENSPGGVCQLVADRLSAKYPGRSMFQGQDTHKVIFFELMLHYREAGDWFPNKFQVERYIRKIQSILNPNPKDFEAVVQSWYQEMFPYN